MQSSIYAPLNVIDQETRQRVLDYIAEAFVDKSRIIISDQEEAFASLVDKIWEIVDKGIVEN